MKESFWSENHQLSGTELREKFPDSFSSARIARRAKAKAKEKWPEIFGASRDVIKFLSRGRTEAELEAAGLSVSDVNAEGYESYCTRNTHGEKVYLLLPEIRKVKLKPKVWKHQWQRDGQPYLWIDMPDKWDKLKIVPLADVHFGSVAHLDVKFREYISYIEQNDNVFAVILGDLLENSHGDSNKGVSIYEQPIRPKTQVEQMIELLSPIAHKILWALPGNHEDRSRTRDYDPLERICEKLDIPYNYMPVYADIIWKDYIFTFHSSHGRSGAGTKGGKINSAIKPQNMQEHVHFTISAHVHDAMVNRTSRICRDRVNFKLEEKKQYVIICPSFMGYFESYAAKSGYEPGSYGAIACDLYANGGYHASG